MKKTFYSPRLLLAGAFLLNLSACRDKQEAVRPTNEEAAYVRLLVTDADSPDVKLVTPASQKVESFTGKFRGSTVYPTAGGRFAAVLNTTSNLVQFFDSGIVDHGNHADVKGTPKWAAVTSEALKPTHTYFWGNRIAIFNDGEGSLSLLTEDDLHREGFKPKVVKVDIPHHGAVVAFTNGTFAVTQKEAAASGTLPQRVKIVDENGQVVKASTIAVTGIHGDAGNGKTALFGTTDGILAVKEDGSQQLIRYPAGFGENWFGSVVHDAASDVFYGFTTKLGVYRIDPATATMNPILITDQLYAFRVDREGKEVVALLNDGALKVLDGRSGTVLREARLLDPIDPAATVKPDLTVTRRMIYLSNPAKGQLIQVSRPDLLIRRTIDLPGKPYKIGLIGAQQDEAGDD